MVLIAFQVTQLNLALNFFPQGERGGGVWQGDVGGGMGKEEAFHVGSWTN